MTRYEIKEARRGRQLRGMGYLEKKEAMKAIVFRLYALKGEDPRGHLDVVDRCASELEVRCSKAFTSCTVEEVQLAMEAGVRGEYGKNTNLYPANLLMWLQSYATSQERKDAIKEQEAADALARERAAMNMSPEEIERRNDDFRRNGPEAAYQYFLENGWDIISSGYGNALYEAMVANGEITLPIDEKTMAEARRRAAARAAHDKGLKAVIALPEEERYKDWNVNTEIVRLAFERRQLREMEDLPC